ncbi:MAG: 4-hydroxythreonine-4-phosphate dehydrogenase PdxA [Candidatus Omnitrophota bacterium]|jgi:4-hydroxythreonine-4-phosphate dehydrogenase
MQAVKIGITMGDPAGIGSEIIAKTLIQPGINRLGKFLIIGDRWVFGQANQRLLGVAYRKSLSSAPNLEFIDFDNVKHKDFRFGRMVPGLGQAAMEYLRMGVELIKAGTVDCLVTAPISKQAVNLAGYKFSGHTEFLAKAFGKKKDDLVMMLLNKHLKISLVTRHLAIRKVSAALDKQAIYKTIILTNYALKNYFSINQPRICVSALNPHAGETGLLGREEIRIISPIIKRAGRISNLTGPMPADTAFCAASRGEFDAVIAMYHDQALIPLKILDFNSGVNLTLGLDFVRTSPLHGTGFDIAGKNIANPASFLSAVKTAVECTKNLRRNRRRITS